MAKAIGKISFLKPGKYQAFPPLDLPNRSWPSKQITKAPIWCSVDLRDGNQALINPLSHQQKLEMFQLLCNLGFKEIEIGFPSASQVEYDFTRALVEEDLIPEDVTPQVLCQAREPLIRRTFEALAGYKKIIFHLYNPTSTLQRKVVFNKSTKEIIEIATTAVKLIKEIASSQKTEVVLQYSPESFTGTEMEFAKEICEAVMDAWGASPENKIILNLPSTVELHTPNIHADQIEWFTKNVKNRDAYILSLHTHNDRGTGIASTELGLLAGADRVEGTLFGNGERTGNVDLIILALNLFTQGIDPEINLSQIDQLREISERLTELPVHQRHPYAGDLVFTAFSGSHQDAIKKGMDLMRENKGTDHSCWAVPYLPIDPNDIGRSYEAIIRINSQSGKGGIAFVLENEFAYRLPKSMHPEVSQIIQTVSDSCGKEISAQQIKEEFLKNFSNLKVPIKFINFNSTPSPEDTETVDCCLTAELYGEERIIYGNGNGPINACKHALTKLLPCSFSLTDFSQHALKAGSSSEAISYIQIQDLNHHFSCYGVGIDANTDKASIKALISALNRILNQHAN